MSESGDTSDARADGDSRPLFDPARERAIERERARTRGRNSDRKSKRSAGKRSATTGGNSATARSESVPSADTGFASASDVTGRGVGLTLVGAFLCALGYYGVLGLQAVGVQVFGSVVPPPFYALTFSVLFVFSLVPRAHRGQSALVWSVLFSVVFGSLLALGTEGLFYLADNPDAATAGYTGLTVLALAIVVASVTYWGVLSVAKTA